MAELIRTMLLVAVLTVHLHLWKTLDVDPDELDPDDPRAFSDYEADQLHDPWEPPPGDRFPSRREWKAMSRVDHYRWRVAFGKDWEFGAPRGPRTAKDWDKLPDDQKTAEVFNNALSDAARRELMERGFDPTTLQTPVPASRSDDDVEGPAPITGEDFVPTPPGDPTFDFDTQTARARNEAALSKVRSGEIELDPETEARVNALVHHAGAPDDMGGSGEAAQRLDHILKEAERRGQPETPFIPVAVAYRNLGPKGVRTIERDNLGRERVVGEMSREEVDSALADEQQQIDNEFSDPSAVTLEQVARWPQDVRMRFLDKHPVEYEALLRAGSSALEE